MSFVIYNKETTITLYNYRTRVETYKTKSAAKGALTRMAKFMEIDVDDFEITDTPNFRANIEKTETKKNLFGGEFTQPVNTPACCDPSTETYWSI